MRLLLLSLLFGIITTISTAQEADSLVIAQDTVAIDTTKTHTFFGGVSASFDYGKFITGFSCFESKFEVTGHLVLLKTTTLTYFHALQLSGELGTGTIEPKNAYPNGNYKVTGDYYRFGIDYLRSINAKSNISFGVRYGLSSYSDEGEVEIESESDLFDNYSRTFTRTDLNASWWEFIIISEGKLFRIYNPENDPKIYGFLNNFYVGANFRLRVLIDQDQVDPETDTVEVYAIPGYGRTFSKSTPAINLFIKYRLDFK